MHQLILYLFLYILISGLGASDGGYTQDKTLAQSSASGHPWPNRLCAKPLERRAFPVKVRLTDVGPYPLPFFAFALVIEDSATMSLERLEEMIKKRLQNPKHTRFVFIKDDATTYSFTASCVAFKDDVIVAGVCQGKDSHWIPITYAYSFLNAKEMQTYWPKETSVELNCASKEARRPMRAFAGVEDTEV